MKKHYESLLLDSDGLRQGDVRLSWLGTAGTFISDGETGILIDPYVSRFRISAIAFRFPLKPDRTHTKLGGKTRQGKNQCRHRKPQPL